MSVSFRFELLTESPKLAVSNRVNQIRRKSRISNKMKIIRSILMVLLYGGSYPYGAHLSVSRFKTAIPPAISPIHWHARSIVTGSVASVGIMPGSLKFNMVPVTKHSAWLAGLNKPSVGNRI